MHTNSAHHMVCCAVRWFIVLNQFGELTVKLYFPREFTLSQRSLPLQQTK